MYEFGITANAVDYIKNLPIDNNHWKNYTYNDKKITVEYISGENVRINVDYPYYINNDKVVITFPQSFADSMGIDNNIMTFIKIP
jgi:hypothetical protein